MTVYTDVFGGANIYPSEVSYSSVTLTADLTLNWPEETSAATNFVTRIIDVTASAGPFSLVMPDAREAANGQTVLFNNVGVNTFLVKDSTGVQLGSIEDDEIRSIAVTRSDWTGG